MANKSKVAQHWTDAAAEKIIRQRGKRDQYVLAAGITPSGIVHFGNVREIITPELVARALSRTGCGVRFIYLWDDYDRFRSVPANLPGDGWERYIGAPLSEIPDPYGSSASYARHFASEFEKQMARLGIEPEWISQADMYSSGAYAEGVRTALEKRQQLREILDLQRTTPLASDWWPAEVYCACAAGASGTTVLSWDGRNELTYKCSICNSERVADLCEGDGVKLGWRVDWPMRWAYHGIDFEAAGKDHHTAGGSWDTAVPLAREIFGVEPPTTLKYDWINVRGVGTMASSRGQLISAADALEVYQPEVVRYLFARSRPDREFEISFDLDVLKTYEDYDRAGRVRSGMESVSTSRRQRETRATELSQVSPDSPQLESEEIPFRHLCNLLQIRDGDVDGVVESLPDDAARQRHYHRAYCAWSWITTHAPEEFRFRLRDPDMSSVPVRPVVANAVADLRDLLGSGKAAESKALHKAIYDLADSHGMQAREFFSELYQILISKNHGPRLAEFILTIGIARIDVLLANVTVSDE